MCQARGASTGVVIRELAAMGFNARTLRTLYAGCGPSAVCSAAIGAVYLLAFYALKRAGTQLACQQQQQRRRRQPAGAAASQLGGAGSARPPLNSEGTHPVVASLAGTGASLVGSIFEAPMESFKLRAQVSSWLGFGLPCSLSCGLSSKNSGAPAWRTPVPDTPAVALLPLRIRRRARCTGRCCTAWWPPPPPMASPRSMQPGWASLSSLSPLTWQSCSRTANFLSGGMRLQHGASA